MIIFSLLLAVVLGGLVFDSVSAVSGGAAGLIPCGNTSDPNNRCTLCHLVLGFKNIIDYGFNIFIFLALLMLVVAGVMYIISTGDQGLMTTAKGIMMNTLFGFAFVLLAWLLVNFTIYMLGANVGVERDSTKTWNNFICNDVPSVMPAPPTGHGATGDW